MRITPFLLTVLCSSVLVACGGGGDDAPAADVADKYVGTLTSCESEGANSGKFSVVNTKTSATTVRYAITITVHMGSTTCSGSGMTVYTEEGNVTYKGTKVIGSDTVDLGEGTVTADNEQTTTEPRTEKDISLISGNRIYFGDDSVGADGYPNAIDREFFLTKQ